jgi:methylmalonyl-CoA epimerase
MILHPSTQRADSRGWGMMAYGFAARGGAISTLRCRVRKGQRRRNMDLIGTESALPKPLIDLVIEVDHVAIAVEDLDVAIGWYSRGLGLSLVEQRTTKGERTSMKSAVLKAGRTIIVLIQGVESDSQVARFVKNFGPGVQHLALAVRDLDAALAALQAEGGGMETPIIADEGIRQAFLRRDPGSGVRIELIERKGGNFTDRSVEQLFRAFERQGLY